MCSPVGLPSLDSLITELSLGVFLNFGLGQASSFFYLDEDGSCEKKSLQSFLIVSL